MQTIKLSDETFSKLQSFAVPLIDTPEDVIKKLLELSQSTSLTVCETAADAPPNEGVIEFAPRDVPSLKFAVVQNYVVNGVSKSSGAYWSTLLADVILACVEKGIGTDRLIGTISTPVCTGFSDAPGYQFVSEANLSFQQLNSDRSFEQICRIARMGQIPVTVTWRWSNDPKASFPGQFGKASLR
jgi:hypothetical protein